MEMEPKEMQPLSKNPSESTSAKVEYLVVDSVAFIKQPSLHVSSTFG